MMTPAHLLQDRPVLLERAYQLTKSFMRGIEPLLRWIGFGRLGPLFELGERMTKGPLFDCRMCGACNLHGTGMTCPMTCPKDIRNGPCGGVRPDGTCEVIPDMECIWVQAWERVDRMGLFSDQIHLVHPPLDRQLEGTSAWLNMLDGRDAVIPSGWTLGTVSDAVERFGGSKKDQG
jgi:hypothetical protein